MSINLRIIDHTNLRLDATEKDIEKLCNEAQKYGFGTVCIRPNYVILAKNLLKDTPVKICTVIGFHTGLNPTEEKIKEAEKAIRDGADELDMVINIDALKRNEFDYVKNDISSIKQVAKSKILKVIIEAGLLSDSQKRKACQIVADSSADFVKTSTGFAKDEKGKKLGATIHDVKLIKSIVGNRLGIKAAGGINTPEFAQKLVDAGATRLGASSSTELISNPKNIQNNDRKLQLKYSWEWFEYHADQRLRAFYYYLIITGALFFGYFRANQGNAGDYISLVICLFGFIVSVAFLCLEIRNVELVNIGRFELENLGIEVSKNDANPNYVKALEKTLPFKYPKRKFFKSLFKHEFWLRLIYFYLALIWFYLILDLFIECNFLNWKIYVPILFFVISIVLAYLFGKRKN